MSIILPNLNHSGFLIPDFPYAQYLLFPPVPRFFLYPLILQQDSLFWLFSGTSLRCQGSFLE